MSRWAPTWRDATHDGCERRIAELSEDNQELREALARVEWIASEALRLGYLHAVSWQQIHDIAAELEATK